MDDNQQLNWTTDRINTIAKSFKIRASAAIEIAGGGITEKQLQTIAVHEKRNADFIAGIAKPLTDNMTNELTELIAKRDTIELPDGAKTHCKKWLKEYIFHRRKDIKSKYIAKGNNHEEDGFTIMAVELNLGMVYKNTQYHENENMHGTDDLFVKDVVYDNKCSWDLDTFPMFDEDIPDDKYDWQLNVYCELRGVENGILAYTLVDADIDVVEREIKWLVNANDIYKRISELVYTKSYFEKLAAEYCAAATFDYFVEIPQSDRIKTFAVKRDAGKIAKLNKRVPMCRDYIAKLLTAKYLK